MNPILQKLQPQGQINPIANILQLKQLMNSPNPQAAAQMLINSNPQLAAFVQANKDRPITEVAGQYGIDLDQISQLMK